MTNPKSLGLAFIDSKPVAAGRLLAAMDAVDAAAFLADIPTGHLTRALSHMSAWSVTAILAQAGSDMASAALRGLPYAHAAAVLRLMSQADRANALAALPQKLQRDFRLSLSYPADTVGAHMTTSIMTQRPDQTVADARAELRRAREADVPIVFVVDQDHQMAGVVSPDALLRNAGTATLQDVMDSSVDALSARTRIAAVADDTGWDAHTYLPVLSRGKAVIGALARKATAPFRGDPPAPPAPVGESLIGSVSTALAATVSGLAQLGLPPSQASRDVADNGVHHDKPKPESR